MANDFCCPPPKMLLLDCVGAVLAVPPNREDWPDAPAVNEVGFEANLKENH